MSGNKGALIIGLVCALIASFLVVKVINQNSKAKIQAIPKTNVVFAKELIPARTVISAEQLELKSVPKEAVTPNTAIKLEELVGMIAKSEILPGEAINLNRVLRKGDQVSMAFMIPPGMRAITIAVNEVIGVAGFIKPNERVDVIGTLEPKDSKSGSVTWTVLQDVEVLAVSQEMGEPIQDEKKEANKNTPAPKLGTSVTLAVTPFQAQKIALAEEKGELRLTLRPAVAETNTNVAPIRESNLVPSTPAPSAPVSRVRERPPEREHHKIEIISGGKTQYITVD